MEPANKFYSMREEIINAFKKSIFPYIDGYQVKKERDEDADEDTDKETDEELNFDSSMKGKGLKILTPKQMTSRLPISLAQLNGGNNSEKLKNEIRQLLYSL